MYENPFDRKFGVEFEFNCPDIYHMRQTRGSYGSLENKFDTMRRILQENKFEDFEVHEDGSEFEVKTSILQGPTGFRRVKRFLELMNNLGASTTLREDGLHVHHDAPEFIDKFGRLQEQPTKTLVENWYRVQSEILRMADPIRNGGWACPRWEEYDIINLRDKFDEYNGRLGRKNLNISALHRYGTIEIRLHEGTLNYEAVLSWVRFGQAFIGKAVDETDSYVASRNPDELMRDIRVSRNASRFLSRKVSSASYQNVRYE